MVAPLREGLQMLLGNAPCDLVGFSFGGMTAGLLLAAHPELAERLVLVGAPAMGVVPNRQFELKAWRHLTDLDEQLAIHRYNLGVLMLHDKRLIDGLALQTACGQRAARPHAAPPPGAHRHPGALVAAGACPVHAIYGEHDALYKSWIHQLEAAFAAAAPDFRGMHLVPNAGHWVQFEQPEAFDAALLAALRSGVALSLRGRWVLSIPGRSCRRSAT
jgi:2-hydroxy-6-oxonona-2,4-dienedioate hydrolase